MNNDALGMIETFGFIPAVAGADAALKSAEVKLLGCRYVGSGLVSVLLSGDVSSVKVAVDAGCYAADKVGSVRWCTVIARTAEGLESVVGDDAPKDKPVAKNKRRALKPPGNQQPIKEATGSVPTPEISLQRLYTLHVQELRGLARQLTGLSLDRPQIRSARKEELIDAIVRHYQQQEEAPDGR